MDLTNSFRQPPGFWREAWVRLLGGGRRGTYANERECGEQLNELALRRTEFERIISHELRTPLNTIALSTDILESEKCFADEDLRRRQLRAIRSAVRQASDLLIDLDLLAMMQHGGSTSPATAPLTEVMQAVAEALRVQAEAAGVELTFAESPPPLHVEKAVARLVLSNLLTNAIKYRDPAKSNRWIRVSAQAECDGWMVVTVADNGIGVASEYQQRVFERHFRARPELAEGSGLGLTIAREVLADRGGGIDLCSEELVGTTVRLHLRAHSHAGTAGISTEVDSPQAAPPATPAWRQMS